MGDGCRLARTCQSKLQHYWLRLPSKAGATRLLQTASVSSDGFCFSRRLPLCDRHGGRVKARCAPSGQFHKSSCPIKLASYGGLINKYAGILKSYIFYFFACRHFCRGTSFLFVIRDPIFLLQLQIHYFSHYRYHTLSILVPVVFPQLRRLPCICGYPVGRGSDTSVDAVGELQSAIFRKLLETSGQCHGCQVESATLALHNVAYPWC